MSNVFGIVYLQSLQIIEFHFGKQFRNTYVPAATEFRNRQVPELGMCISVSYRVPARLHSTLCWFPAINLHEPANKSSDIRQQHFPYTDFNNFNGN